jgi:hypothetical protein
MKLRMQGNSIRLRLSADEVTKLLQTGSVKEEVAFGPETSLAYELRTAPDAPDVCAWLKGGEIVVEIPQSLAADWANSDEVGLSNVQQFCDGTSLKIAVEKEFECLHGPPGEAGRRLYANPAKPAGAPSSPA